MNMHACRWVGGWVCEGGCVWVCVCVCVCVCLWVGGWCVCVCVCGWVGVSEMEVGYSLVDVD